MNKCLESCTGIGEIQFMELILQEVPHDERVYFIEAHGQQLREQYCSEVCPVTKFRRKYERK